jgi:transcriptional regulator with XRE-family HTH domain
MTTFGKHVRELREQKRKDDPCFSLRQVAARAGIEPTYLSKLERGELAPPSEETTRRIAEDLGEDPDVLLALAGKVSGDLQAIIRKRPRLFAELIRQLKSAPDHAILTVVRQCAMVIGESTEESDDYTGTRKPGLPIPGGA